MLDGATFLSMAMGRTLDLSTLNCRILFELNQLNWNKVIKVDAEIF